MKLSAFAAGLSALALMSGCATKNYGRQGELTSYERDTMSCREIDLEEAKVHGFLNHVSKESEFDGRSVLSFLGDFGIGNLMERSSAVDSATARLAQLQEARLRKGCGGANAATRGATLPVGPASPAPQLVAQNNPQAQKPVAIGRYSYEAEHLPEVRSTCNPYPAASLVAQGAGFETFTVACADGDTISVRCERAGCRVLR